MKFTTTVAVIALGATAISSAQAALSPACTTYLTALGAPTNPLAKCRVYTTLGFPALTHANDHDTPKLQKAITDYCATTPCTSDQYAGVYKDINTNCAADMVAANQADLGTDMYMWYMSPPQREAICLQSSKNTTCVIDSINDMIARAQFPNANPNEDDLYGYLQYVTPMLSAKDTNATAFCTTCNQEVANIFSNYYTKSPSPYLLNFDQKLTSDKYKDDLSYQYKSSCQVTLGANFKPVDNNTTAASNGTSSGKNDKGNAGQAAAVMSMGGVAAAVVAVAGVLAMF
ncbi:hypothetical protein EC957_012178 [Mortierella hygrophila]|uniref:Secreted protein n=1 Tax=Mortierella hygrophila TaxID=979708 RepID=A0A9P6K3R1_9FUNG|nr:hypothetical protein EC957_012178 [Mortierella hygrophila]